MPTRALHPRLQLPTQVLILSLCLGIYGVPSAWAQVALVQKTFHSTGDLSNSVTFPNSNTAGNLIVVSVGWANGGNATVSDSRGNSYVSAVGPTTDSGSSQIWYAANIATGPNTVTVDFSGVWNNSIIAVFEYSGLSSSSVLDVTAAATGRGSALNTGSVTTTQANELIFASGYGNSGGTLTADPNYIMELYATQTGTHLGLEDRSVQATGTYNATFTDTGAWDWVAQIATFKVGSSSSGICGQLDDGLTQIPPNYNSFSPPAVGQSYVDPQYGCTVVRLTSGISQFGLPAHHYYGTLTSLSADDSKVMLFLDDGSAAIVDLSGNIVVAPNSMPASNTNNYPWDPVNPAVFYYSNSNQFLKATVSGNSVSSAALHTFSAYSSCTIPDQEDLSDDGSKIWLVCTPSGGSASQNVAVLYNLATNTVISNTLVVGAQEGGWHKIQIFPSGKMFLTGGSLCNGTQCIYNTDGSLYWQPPFAYSGHSEVGTDLQGREVLISTASGVSSLNSCGSEMWSSLTVIDINAKAPVNCLIGAPPNPKIPSWEVSYRDSANSSSGKWVLLSMFDQGTCPDYSCFYPQDLASNWQSLWGPYYEELVLAKIDGSQIYRLGYSWSRSAENYWAVPRASISRDGRYLVFDSNFDISNTGFAQYTDVYMIKIQ